MRGWPEAAARMVAAFAAFAQVAAPVAVAALWQGAAVAVALVLCLRLAPRVSAAHRFAAWAAGFAVVAGLPFLAVARAFAAARTPPRRLAQLRQDRGLQLDSRWGFAIAALWLAASALSRRRARLSLAAPAQIVEDGARPVEAEASLRSLLAVCIFRAARPSKSAPRASSTVPA